MPANYKLVGVELSDADIELQDDETTVVITLKNAIANGTTFVATVNPILAKGSTTVKTPIFTKTLTFSDTVKPEVKDVKYPAFALAEVLFTEEMSEIGSVIISAPLHDTSKDAVVYALDEDTLEFKNLQKDVVYTVTITGAKDQSGNLITPNPATVTLTNTLDPDTTKPTVVSIEATKVGELKITFSEKLQKQSSPVVRYAKITVDGTYFHARPEWSKFDKTGTVLTINHDKFEAGIKSITVSEYNDLSGNVGNPYTKAVEFKADTTAPKYVSHEVKTISGVQYLIVKFDETVTVNNSAASALTGTYLDDKSITNSFTDVATSKATLYDYDEVGYSDSLKIELTNLPVGIYSAIVTEKLAQDTAYGTTNKSVAIPVSFTLGTVADTVKPEVKSVTVQNAEDTVVVVFNKSVTAATALNVSNYLVEGEAVFEKAIFEGSDKKVELTLKANIINPTGVREFVIKNVADAAGNVMLTDTRQVEFKENVKPVLESAKITGAKSIVATFSKNVDGTAVFEVYVDGVKATTGFGTGALSGKTVTITAENALTLSKSYEVKYISGLTDKASPANTVVAGTLVTVTN